MDIDYNSLKRGMTAIQTTFDTVKTEPDKRLTLLIIAFEYSKTANEMFALLAYVKSLGYNCPLCSFALDRCSADLNLMGVTVKKIRQLPRLFSLLKIKRWSLIWLKYKRRRIGEIKKITIVIFF